MVIPSGKGAVSASIILYKAKENGTAPIGIICREADPLTVECAITLDIPLIDRLEKDPIDSIKNDRTVEILGDEGAVLLES